MRSLHMVFRPVARWMRRWRHFPSATWRGTRQREHAVAARALLLLAANAALAFEDPAGTEVREATEESAAAQHGAGRSGGPGPDLADDVRRESRLACVTRLAEIGGWEWDIETGAVQWSDEAAHILGAGPTPPDATPETLLAFVHPVDRAMVQHALKEALRGVRPYQSEHLVRRPNGVDRIVLERGEVTFDAARRPLRLVCAVQDITESRRTEAVLRERMRWLAESGQRYRQLLECSPTGIVVHCGGGIVFANPAAADLLGSAAAEALPGKQMADFLDAHDWKVLQDLPWRPQGEGAQRRPVRIRLQRLDGATVAAEVTAAHVLHHGVPGVQLVLQDVTRRERAERRQAQLERAVHEAAKEWGVTFDAVDLPVFVADEAGVVRRANRAAALLIGTSPGQLAGRPLTELGWREPWATARRLVEAARRSGAPRADRTRDPASHSMWDVRVAPARVRGGDRLFTITVNDLSPIERLQETLRRTERMAAMGGLIASVAHEVRNPLFGMLATLDAAEVEAKPGDRYEAYLRNLRYGANRLSDLMRQLIEYGKPVKPARHPIGLRGVVESAAADCAPLALPKRVRLANRVSAGLPPIAADPSRLGDVFRNLIANAIVHAPSGTTVVVDAAVYDDGGQHGLRCQVSDGGPGFAPQDLPHVFEPFFTRRKGGTGIGLAIVQSVVEQHGGTVLASNHPKGGAVVTIRIPLESVPTESLAHAANYPAR